MSKLLHRDMQGFTLVELMVALALSSFMLLGAFQIFDANFKAYNLLVSDSNIQESGRISRAIMIKDIQMANNLGCRVKSQGYIGADIFLTGAHPNFDLQLFEGFSLATNVAAGKAISDLNKLHTTGDNTLVENNTDVLTLARATGVASQMVKHDKNKIKMTGTEFRAGDYLMLRSCTDSILTEIFQVVAVIDSVNSQILTLNTEAHGTYLKNGAQLMAIAVYKLEGISYFVAKGAASTEYETVLSLFRKVNNQAAEEFIAGVDDLQISYETTDGTLSSYGSGSTKNQVVIAKAIHVHLVLRSDSARNNGIFTGPDFGKTDGSAYPRDGKLRRYITFSGKVRS